MADPRVQKLREIALSDPDPVRRQKAQALLRQRNVPAQEQMSDERRAVLQRKVAESQERTARLRKESGDPSAGNLATAMRAVGQTASDLATAEGLSEFGGNIERQGADLAAGVGDVADWMTAGGYRRYYRDPVVAAAFGDDGLEQLRQSEAAPAGFQRNMGRAIGLAPAALMAAAALPANAGILQTAGATAATQAPIALGRRMSEGEDLSDAAAGAVQDAAVAGLVGGALRTAGRTSTGTAQMVDEVRRLPSVRSSVIADLGTRVVGAAARPVGAVAQKALQGQIIAPTVTAGQAIAQADDEMPQLPPNFAELPMPEKMRAAAAHSKAKERVLSQRILRKRKKPKRDEFAGQTVDPITGEVLE